MTAPVYDRWGIAVYHADNFDVLREMPDCSVDSIVTDPPAGIGFMREWDSNRGGRDQWVEWLRVRMAEALRVLKPGGHALVWAMPRTSHWTGLALEDAGFDIRDVVQHVYENGFPKSLDVSKAIDKVRDDREEIVEVAMWLAEQMKRIGFSRRELDQHMETNGMAYHWTTDRPQASVPNWAQWDIMKRFMGLPDDMDNQVYRLNARKGTLGEAWDSREALGISGTLLQQRNAPGRAGIAWGDKSSEGKRVTITAAASPAAQRWQGWGTALKPSAEPWWLVRKPFSQTVAANVQKHGTGAINIDATRGPDGQWPRNVAALPKAGPSERPMVNGEQHPTVKSVALCRWLVRLVTPPGGTVLDLFAGTGPVGAAARAEGMKAVLIEQDEQSIGFIKARLDARTKTEAGAPADDGAPMDLLDLLGDAP